MLHTIYSTWFHVSYDMMWRQAMPHECVKQVGLIRAKNNINLIQYAAIRSSTSGSILQNPTDGNEGETRRITRKPTVSVTAITSFKWCEFQGYYQMSDSYATRRIPRRFVEKGTILHDGLDSAATVRKSVNMRPSNAYEMYINKICMSILAMTDLLEYGLAREIMVIGLFNCDDTGQNPHQPELVEGIVDQLALCRTLEDAKKSDLELIRDMQCYRRELNGIAVKPKNVVFHKEGDEFHMNEQEIANDQNGLSNWSLGRMHDQICSDYSAPSKYGALDKAYLKFYLSDSKCVEYNAYQRGLTMDGNTPAYLQLQIYRKMFESLINGRVDSEAVKKVLRERFKHADDTGYPQKLSNGSSIDKSKIKKSRFSRNRWHGIDIDATLPRFSDQIVANMLSELNAIPTYHKRLNLSRYIDEDGNPKLCSLTLSDIFDLYFDIFKLCGTTPVAEDMVVKYYTLTGNLEQSFSKWYDALADTMMKRDNDDEHGQADLVKQIMLVLNEGGDDRNALLNAMDRTGPESVYILGENVKFLGSSLLKYDDNMTDAEIRKCINVLHGELTEESLKGPKDSTRERQACSTCSYFNECSWRKEHGDTSIKNQVPD